AVAAPMGSGTLALLRAAGLSPADAVSRLLATVKDLGPPGRDPDFGVGRIDVTNAVARLPVVTAHVAARSVQAARAAAPRPTSQSAAHPVHPVLHPSAPTRVASPPPPAVPALAGSGGAGRSPSQPAA